jgi:hypothetical protein
MQIWHSVSNSPVVMSNPADLYVTVRSVALATDEVERQVPLEEQLEKAATLSYQMPDATTEIRRLDDLQRTLDKELLRYRSIQRPHHAVLNDWLNRNEDLSLADVNLGDSDRTLRDVAGEELSGLGRYAMRGDLRLWMERVAQLDSAVGSIAGEWSVEDLRVIDEEMRAQTKRVVAKEAVQKSQQNVAVIQALCRNLRIISEGRDFNIDPEFTPDDAAQLQRLHEKVDDWRATVERNGHPTKLAEREIERRIAEAEEKRRGLAQSAVEAATSHGLHLSEAQLDQVLEAVYKEHQPSTFLSKREKAAIEHQMAAAKANAEAIVAAAERARLRDKSRVEALQRQVEDLRDVIATYQSNPQVQREFVEGLERTNAQIEITAEVLARKRISECESVVAQHMSEYESLKVAFQEACKRVSNMHAENERCKSEIVTLRDAWRRVTQLQAQQDEELARIHGGQVSQLQRVVSTLADVVGVTVHALSKIAASCAAQLNTAHPHGTVSDDRHLVRDNLESIVSWSQHLQGLGSISDGTRTAARELAARASRTLGSGETAHSAVTASDTEKLEQRGFIDGLVRKLDHAGAELQGKYREQRYMKNVVAYFVKIVSSLLDGTYETVSAQYNREQDASSRKTLPFPPSDAVAPDENYSLPWADELKSLDRLLMQLRTELSDSVDRTGTTNALLAAVEAVAETHQPTSSSQATNPSVDTHAGDTKPARKIAVVDSAIEHVRRDARMLLHDHQRQGFSRRTAVHLLRDITRSRQDQPSTAGVRGSSPPTDLRVQVVDAFRKRHEVSDDQAPLRMDNANAGVQKQASRPKTKL